MNNRRARTNPSVLKSRPCALVCWIRVISNHFAELLSSMPRPAIVATRSVCFMELSLRFETQKPETQLSKMSCRHRSPHRAKSLHSSKHHHPAQAPQLAHFVGIRVPRFGMVGRCQTNSQGLVKTKRGLARCGTAVVPPTLPGTTIYELHLLFMYAADQPHAPPLGRQAGHARCHPGCFLYPQPSTSEPPPLHVFSRVTASGP